MEMTRYYGQLVKVGGYDVKAAIVAGCWNIDYVEVPIGDEIEYRVAIHQEGKKIVKVLPGVIIFEG